MRYLLIRQRHADFGEEFGPWVHAESPDYTWALESSYGRDDLVLLTQEEALLDPDYREAVLRYDRKDDSEHARYEALEAAEIAAEDLEDARFEAQFKD